MNTLLSLLNTEKEKRIEILKNMSREEKSTIFKNIPKLTQMLKLTPFDYQEQVRRKYEHIKRYPNDIFFDYMSTIDSKGNVSTYKHICVSTNGDIITLPEDRGLYINCNKDWKGENNYRGMRVGDDQMRIHRVIASTFLPIPDNLRSFSGPRVEVNHINLKKYDNSITNLEWVDQIRNGEHSRENNEYNHDGNKLIEVIVDNGFLGKQFVINVLNDQHNANDMIKYSGFRVTSIPKEKVNEYEVGVPEDIRKLFNEDKSYFQTQIKPIIGEIIAGTYRGIKFSFFGTKDMPHYFDQPTISKAVNRMIHYTYACVWRVGTHREAIPLRKFATESILMDCKQQGRLVGPYKGVVERGTYRGYVFYILSDRDMVNCFNKNKLYMAAERNTLCDGCRIRRVRLKDVPDDYPIIDYEIYGDVRGLKYR